MAEKEVTIEELEKRIRNLRKDYLDFAVVTIFALLLIWIRVVLGNSLEAIWFDIVIVLWMFIATARICYLYRHRIGN